MALLSSPLAPVVAILTMSDDEQQFRGNRRNFADLIRVGREQGFIVYVLTVRHLQLKEPQLTGYTYEERTKTWREQRFPFPKIIYNRIPLREDELKTNVKRKLSACYKNHRVHLFNPRFFSKWQLVNWLAKNPQTKTFIPFTQKLTSKETLQQCIDNFPLLYLKPSSGKAGQGIMTIDYEQDRKLPLRLKIQSDKKSNVCGFTTVDDLWEKLQPYTQECTYIVQQGIQLATINKRTFDLRVLVQKNEQGQWDVTGIGARVAGLKSITTHVPRGGSIDNPHKLLVLVFGKLAATHLLHQVRAAVLLIANQIEQGARQNHAEMSMDLGVDTRGGIWFFEANAKPMKFDEPDIRRRSLERIFQYSRYLIQNQS